MKESISIRLLRTLERGVAALGDEAQALIRSFVVARTTPEGAFMDKSGKADIYYTSFGLSLARALGLEGDVKAREDYLNAIDADALDMVHYAAFVRSRMLNRLERSRTMFLLKSVTGDKIRPVESFRAVPNNDLTSPYAQFILYSLLEDTGNSPTVADLLPYHRTGGGYANTRSGQTASTNATAAALMVLGQSKGYKANEDVEWLRSKQLSNGGFCAEAGTPLPDVLSTATALFTLRSYGVQPHYSAAEFIEAHWLDDGGFAPTIVEEQSDVEYLFYGLLALGTL